VGFLRIRRPTPAARAIKRIDRMVHLLPHCSYYCLRSVFDGIAVHFACQEDHSHSSCVPAQSIVHHDDFLNDAPAGMRGPLALWRLQTVLPVVAVVTQGGQNAAGPRLQEPSRTFTSQHGRDWLALLSTDRNPAGHGYAPRADSGYTPRIDTSLELDGSSSVDRQTVGQRARRRHTVAA
jgi:hypothetical protein